MGTINKYHELYVWLWLKTQRYWVRISVRSMLVTEGNVGLHIMCSELFKRMCSAAYFTVHYEEPLKSFDNSREKYRLRASFCRDIAMIV